MFITRMVQNVMTVFRSVTNDQALPVYSVHFRISIYKRLSFIIQCTNTLGLTLDTW